MKNFGRFIFAFCLLAITTFGQAPGTVHVTWNASATTPVTYNVYHSAAAVGQYTKVNTAPITTLAFDDDVNTSGYWVVTAVDPAGDESVKSASVTLPVPPSGVKVVGN